MPLKYATCPVEPEREEPEGEVVAIIEPFALTARNAPAGVARPVTARLVVVAFVAKRFVVEAVPFTSSLKFGLTVPKPIFPAVEINRDEVAVRERPAAA